MHKGQISRARCETSLENVRNLDSCWNESTSFYDRITLIIQQKRNYRKGCFLNYTSSVFA